MQIILQEDVEKLGSRGDVVEVADGYARNYLLPHKLAMDASAGNMKRLAKMREAFAKREAVERGDAETLAGLLAAVSVTVSRKAGENEQLFGSVTSADISEGLAAQGYQVDKRKIQVADAIKQIGEFDVPIKLHRDVQATIKLIVQRES
jgi:large subunit ribosomal protein L9